MWEMSTMERRYSVPPSVLSAFSEGGQTTEDLHAWSIYRQNLNSDFTDSALDTGHKSQPPFGDFRLRESTVQTILNHPKYGPRLESQSELARNVFTYLRFGLPRVLPFNTPRRATSDPDFRNGVMLAPQQVQRVGRLKGASSEADLLATRDHRPASRISSRISPEHRNGKSDAVFHQEGPMLNERFFPKSNQPSARYPHLQVRDLSYELDMSSAWHTLCGGARTKLRMLEGISFEARGGEILAIMATTESEGTAVLDILANRHRKWRCRLRGSFLLNGLPLHERCVAYVQRHTDLGQDMSVRQTMLFASLLQQPDNDRGFDTKSRINALIEDLGLGQVKHTRVSDLTESEKRRLNVATQLLLDTDVVLVDQATSGMDIFDTFFLVEYLRQWAARGRIVIITIHPPTYEIFTMIARVAVISTGRLVYFGKRRDMLPYFAYIDFPCPAYKNPSDYYLDLVTLDNLSAEAMLESSQRVENLVEIFRRRQEALSEPPPPTVPPALVTRAGVCTQVLALWIRVLIYTFPFNVVGFCRELMLAALVSVSVGGVYWNVRGSREHEDLEDRFGFYYVMLCLAVWPNLLYTIHSAWKEKATVVRDTRERLYHKFTFALCKLTYSLVPAAAVGVAYSVPAYSMAGLHSTSRPFGLYIAYMLLYLLSLRMLGIACAWACSSRHLAAAWAGLAMTSLSLSAGYTTHARDLPLQRVRFASPVHAMLRVLAQLDLTGEEEDARFACSRNPVVTQENGILMRAECGLPTAASALTYHDLNEVWPLYQPIAVLLLFHVICLVLGLVFFVTRRR